MEERGGGGNSPWCHVQTEIPRKWKICVGKEMRFLDNEVICLWVHAHVAACLKGISFSKPVSDVAPFRVFVCHRQGCVNDSWRTGRRHWQCLSTVSVFILARERWWESGTLLLSNRTDSLTFGYFCWLRCNMTYIVAFVLVYRRKRKDKGHPATGRGGPRGSG